MPNQKRRRRAGAPLRLGAARRRMATPPAMPVSPPELEAVIDKDRAFFRARPGRTTRVRWTEQPELDAFARAGEVLPVVPPGYRWATVVHQVVPGGRLRRLCAWPNDRPCDAPESVCLDLFRFLNGASDTVVGQIEAERRGRLH